MTEAILDKARELGIELSKSKEFISVREAELMMMQNPVAQSIIREFENKQHDLQALQAQGLPLSEEQQREVEELYRRMFENPYISTFFKAQETFDNILGQVNKIISEFIGIGQGCACDDEDPHQQNCGCEDCS